MAALAGLEHPGEPFPPTIHNRCHTILSDMNTMELLHTFQQEHSASEFYMQTHFRYSFYAVV